MTYIDEYRDFFTLALAKAHAAKDTNRVAKLELCREYFLNPAFRQYLENLTWELNQKRA